MIDTDRDPNAWVLDLPKRPDGIIVSDADIPTRCEQIRQGLEYVKDQDALPVASYFMVDVLLMDIETSHREQCHQVAMLQDLFVKWHRSRGYAPDTLRYREWIDAYAACCAAGLLPEDTDR